MSKKCLNCGSEIFNKRNIFCCRSCSASYNNKKRKLTENTKKKISNSIKQKLLNGEKIGCCKINLDKNQNKIKKICIGCGKEFFTYKSQNHIFCSLKCKNENWKRLAKTIAPNSGGYRKGSGTGKKGWFKGYWCDSSYELAWVIYHIDHNITFERNYQKFEYEYQNKKYFYIPDFIKEKTFYEIKGYLDAKSKEKHKQFNGDLQILFKKDMIHIFNYVENKYGKDFIKLYDKNTYAEKTNKCIICGKDAKNIYCSRKCSMIGNRKITKIKTT